MTEKTERTKFKIYVRGRDKLKVKARGHPKPKNPSAVAFVLRHISGLTYDEQCSEIERLLKVVEHTPADRAAIEQILKNRRCRKSP
jgi:hypothetical protein